MIISVLNLSGLASYLSKRGWNASIVDATKFVLDKKGRPSPWQEFMTLQKGGCTIELAGAMFAKAALEFWMPDTFANSAQALYERGPVLGDAPKKSVVFEEEYKAWD